jgi:hypothetical protein
MRNHKTAEEAKKEYIACMGEDLGRVFHALWQEVAWLYIKWGEYVDLFGKKPSRIELMNRAAPGFFRIVQDSLWEETILHIARLTDPPRTAGRDNLTIQRLPELIQDSQLLAKLSGLIKLAIQSTKFCRDWRNRRIAHTDLHLAIEDGINPLKPASRKLVKEALITLVNVLNAITQHYQDCESSFDVPACYGGGESLLYVIDDGLRADEERRKRIERGEYNKEDLATRDI